MSHSALYDGSDLRYDVENYLSRALCREGSFQRVVKRLLT